MKVISAYSIKHGVGKTAAAVNLAYLCALEGARTLLWDLDPQRTAAALLGHQSATDDSRKKLVFGDSELAGSIIHSRYQNLDIVPSEFRSKALDSYLERADKRDDRAAHRRLDRMLASLAADYDCVILDCPPGINLLSASVFYATDILLVPVVPTTLSVRAFDLLTKYVDEEQRKDRARDISIAAFFSMVDRRKPLHASFVEVLPEERSGVLRCAITEEPDIAQMKANGAPVHIFAPASRAAAAYESLWHEVRMLTGNTWSSMSLTSVG